MRKTTLFTMTAIVLVALLAVPLAFAQRRHAMRGEGGFGGPMGGPMILGHLAHAKQELGLSDQQVSDIKAVFQGLRDQNQASRTTTRSTMRQAVQTLINDPNNVAGAQALIDQQIDAERTMKANTLAATSKALKVLTPEQRTKLSTLLADRMSRRAK
jgi:Spy/CpxP family protein refolding chaperone